MNDTIINTITIIVFFFHLIAMFIGYKTQKTTLITPYINAVTVIGIFIFWSINNLNTKQHHFDFYELLVLGLEACAFIFALYTIIGASNKTYVKIINYVIFGIHIVSTIIMLFYMLLFKFNKLF